MGSNPPGYTFFLFSDSRDLIIHYHKLRKLKFANHLIIYQKCPFKGRIVPDRLHSELCAWGVKLVTDLIISKKQLRNQTLKHHFEIRLQKIHTRRSKTTLSGLPSQTLRSKSTITISMWMIFKLSTTLASTVHAGKPWLNSKIIYRKKKLFWEFIKRHIYFLTFL